MSSFEHPRQKNVQTDIHGDIVPHADASIRLDTRSKAGVSGLVNLSRLHVRQAYCATCRGLQSHPRRLSAWFKGLFPACAVRREKGLDIAYRGCKGRRTLTCLGGEADLPPMNPFCGALHSFMQGCWLMHQWTAVLQIALGDISVAC